MTGAPWAYHPHIGAWVALVALTSLLVAAGRLGSGRHSRTPRQRRHLILALLSLAVAVTWPLGDLAAHWSLTALLVQRLLLTLVCAPLLLLSLPRPALARLTRPAAVDAVVEFVSRPVTAAIVFTVVVVGTLSGPAVAAQASAATMRGVFDGLLLGAGVVLWTPALGHVPGARRVSPVGRAAYLVIQSVLPNFPAIVYIFARHPLYAAFAHTHRALGLSALTDQQVAGIVAKIGTLPVLWTAAWLALARAQRAEELGIDEPLYWADVERALERTDRRQRRLAPAEPTGPQTGAEGRAEE